MFNYTTDVKLFAYVSMSFLLNRLCPVKGDGLITYATIPFCVHVQLLYFSLV